MARVDSLRVGGEELREFVEKVPVGLRPSGEGDEIRKEYLRSLLAKYLLIVEGRRRGLDSQRTVRGLVEKRGELLLMRRYREEVGEGMERNELEKLLRERVDRLAEELEWRVDEKGLAILLDGDFAGTRISLKEMEREVAETPLFVFRSGSVSIGRYLEVLWENPMRRLAGWGLRDSVEVRRAGETLVRPRVMQVELARRAGIDARPEVELEARSIEEEAVLEELRRGEMARPVAVEEAEIDSFYRANGERLRRADGFYIVELLVGTEAEGKRMRESLDSGETLSSLAQQWTIRPGMREEAGLLYVHGEDRGKWPKLYRQVDGAVPDEVIGPVPVEGGYSLFKVLHRDRGEVPALEEVGNKIRFLLQRQKKEKRFEGLVDSLMDADRERIYIDEGELRLALPDSLLERLAGSGKVN